MDPGDAKHRENDCPGLATWRSLACLPNPVCGLGDLGGCLELGVVVVSASACLVASTGQQSLGAHGQHGVPVEGAPQPELVLVQAGLPLPLLVALFQDWDEDEGQGGSELLYSVFPWNEACRARLRRLRSAHRRPTGATGPASRRATRPARATAAACR